MIDCSVEWIKRGAYQSERVFAGLTATSFFNDVLTLSDLFADCGYLYRDDLIEHVGQTLP